MKLSIVIPTLNEEENLKKLLPELIKTLNGLDHEIIIVDGNSTDKTREVAKKFGVSVIIQKNPGYGNALKEALKLTSGDKIVTMDADLSHTPEFIVKMLKVDSDIVIASRYIKGGSYRMPLLRYILSRLLNKFYSIVLSLPFKDVSSGFRAYRKKVFDHIKPESTGFEILEEIIFKSHLLKFKIKELPFHYSYRSSGRSHVNFLKFGLRYLKMLFRLWMIKISFKKR